MPVKKMSRNAASHAASRAPGSGAAIRVPDFVAVRPCIFVVDVCQRPDVPRPAGRQFDGEVNKALKLSI